MLMNWSGPSQLAAPRSLEFDRARMSQGHTKIGLGTQALLACKLACSIYLNAPLVISTSGSSQSSLGQLHYLVMLCSCALFAARHCLDTFPFGCYQVLTSLFLSVAHGANNARTSVGVLTLMRDLQSTGVVTATVHIGFTSRGFGAVGMALGTLLWGFRLAPITGGHISTSH